MRAGNERRVKAQLFATPTAPNAAERSTLRELLDSPLQHTPSCRERKGGEDGGGIKGERARGNGGG
jgi:hypothetical protein